jgi:hypothetical protein
MGEAALQRDGVQKQKSQEANSAHFMFYFILILGIWNGTMTLSLSK